MKNLAASTDRCQHCEADRGFYRLNGGMWCNACGHRKGEAKALPRIPSSAPEIQIRNIEYTRK